MPKPDEPASTETPPADDATPGDSHLTKEPEEHLPQLVEEALEGVVDDIIEELGDPSELRRVTREVILSRIETTEGAFPPPSMLHRYEAIHPGFTQDLMDEFKAEGQSRRSLQRRSLNAQIAITVLGQIFAFLIAFAGLGFGAYLIHGGHSIAGYAVLVTAVGGIVASFLYLQRDRRRNEDTSSKGSTAS